MSTSLVDIKDNKLVYNANVDNIIEFIDKNKRKYNLE